MARPPASSRERARNGSAARGVVAIPGAFDDLPVKTLQDYVGRYALGDGVFFVIRREGAGLVGGTEGRPPNPLRAEAPDLLFIPGQPRVRLLFRRGPDHRVVDFVFRREAEDLVYRRIG
jgi:hypothetical protein